MNTRDFLAKVHEHEKTRPDRKHCTDCGEIPAFVPRVHVLNLSQGSMATYRLQLPHLCDSCCAKRGFTRHGILAPKLREFQKVSEVLEEHLEKVSEWSHRSLERSVKELTDQGMSEADAKDVLGVK
jgi:hypothetical protein